MVYTPDRFRRRKRILLSVIGLGTILFFGAALLDGGTTRIGKLFVFVGFGIAAVSTPLFAFGFRCPQCRERISAADVPYGRLLEFPNFCSNCGLDFNDTASSNDTI